MKNVYRLEKWVFHNCVETVEFTNKQKAQKWLKQSGWWNSWDAGNCALYGYKNNEEIDLIEEKGWWPQGWWPL